MKTLIFADTHLSNRVHRKKLNYLKSIIEPADRVIIAGDFWDGFLTTLDKFTASGWNELFPLLLERQAIYVFGNHDRVEWSNDKVKLFSVQQAMAVDVIIGQRQFHITHGHTVFTSLEDKIPALNHSVPLRIGANMDVLHKLVWGRRFLSKDSTINAPMRDFTASSLPSPVFLICGHSHYPEIDHQHRIANTGFIGMGFGNYLIIEDDQLELIKEKY